MLTLSAPTPTPRRRSIRPIALFLLCGLALALPVMAEDQPAGGKATLPAGVTAPPAGPAETLPVTRITLYRSGVGYFMRQGLVSDAANVQLKFDVSQINDVLKTLQVLDLSGGRVETVSYASKDPLARRLGSFSLQIGDNPSLPSLLERLRGSAVTLMALEGQITGTVLSVETRKIPSGGGDGKGVIVDTPVVNIVTTTGIRSVPVPTITSFTIQDKQLAEELTKALAALAESRAERTKMVDLTLNGQGSRQVVVAYVHETPVWKTSYRLVLPDPAGEKKAAPGADAANPPNGDKKDAKSADPSPVLQGWAIVENTTDQDWTNVRLSLVSGRPVSFKMDLYEPLYVFRPEVAVPTVPGVMPKSYEGGMAREAEKAAAKPMAPPAGSPAPMSRARGGAGGGPGDPGTTGAYRKADADGFASSLSDGRPMSAEEMINYAPGSQARAAEVGEVFQYELASPVTIERQRSAMIPIINANVSGRRVSIYNLSDRADHPMRGVEITNSTELQLLPGPLAVFDAGAYAGDATIGQVSPGEKRFLAYAVDLDVGVITRPLNESNLIKVKIVGGSFEQTIVQRAGMNYRFENKDAKRGRTIVVEHPKMEGWELKTAAKPDEQTQGLYRFSVALDASKPGEIAIVQERTDKQILGIDSYDMDSILRLQKDGKLSEAVAAAVREIGKKQGAINEQERLLAETDKQINTLKQDQLRITQVMTPLDRQTDAYRNYLTKLNKQEGEIDTLTTKRSAAQEQLDAMRKALVETLRNLNVD